MSLTRSPNVRIIRSVYPLNTYNGPFLHATTRPPFLLRVNCVSLFDQHLALESIDKAKFVLPSASTPAADGTATLRFSGHFSKGSTYRQNAASYYFSLVIMDEETEELQFSPCRRNIGQPLLRRSRSKRRRPSC